MEQLSKEVMLAFLKQLQEIQYNCLGTKAGLEITVVNHRDGDFSMNVMVVDTTMSIIKREREINFENFYLYTFYNIDENQSKINTIKELVNRINHDD